ncbi:MAG: ABC transporter substrate-binding protein [Rhodocyclaceae bacterium]
MRLLPFAALLLSCAALAADCPRIVSQSPYITLQLEWLGLTKCIVGASRYEKHIQVADTGGVIDPDGRAIARLKPDLVITSNWTKPEALAAVTPANAHALRLDSFRSMSEIEENLRQIGHAAGVPDTEARAAAFAHLWRKKAQGIGRGERVLLLSSCTGQPYSFGRQTWLGELFTAMGFALVETASGVRHLAREATEKEIAARIEAVRPDLVFIFTRQIADHCAAIPLPEGVRLVPLDGDKFLHPAPVLLDGLDELRRTMTKLDR